jgi:hypothetical protein
VIQAGACFVVTRSLTGPGRREQLRPGDHHLDRERYWPCSIDFLLGHCTLHRGRHDYSGYSTNGGTPPGIAWFKDQCHICFQDHGGNGLMHITNLTGEGRGWNRPASWYHGVNTSAGPAAVAAGGKVHVFYRVPNGDGIFHQDSRQRRRLGASRLHRPGLRWAAAGDPPPTPTPCPTSRSSKTRTAGRRATAESQPVTIRPRGAVLQAGRRFDPRCPAIKGVAVVHDVVLNQVLLPLRERRRDDHCGGGSRAAIG